MKVLAIDDSSTVLELISTALSSKGYEVATAASGKEGLKKYGEFKPDIVTLDLAMPAMDGYETLASLKRLDKYVNVIMLTAANHSSALRRCLQEGAIDFISKPFGAGEIESAIRRAMESRKYCNHDAAILFSKVRGKLLNVANGSFFSDSAIELKSVQTIRNLVVDQNRYGAAQGQQWVPPEHHICFVTRITGEKEGMVMSMIETGDLQHLFAVTDDNNEKLSDRAIEFFNMINMKVVSELANSTRSDINGEAAISFTRPGTTRNLWNETARMWDRIEMGIYEMIRAGKTVQLGVLLCYDGELFR